MDRIATENLFLLEFLVDDVHHKCECDTPPGDMCITFQFLDNAPLDVCENDFNEMRNDQKNNNNNIRVGKSCLFSLTAAQAAQATHTFDVLVTVYKRMRPGWLPERIELGNALISISNLFNELISGMDAASQTNEPPTAKTLRDTFKLSSESGEDCGTITLYMRMSCFGKLIVTQFQMNLDDKSVLFKDKEGSAIYKYKKSKRSSVGLEESNVGPCGMSQAPTKQQQQQQQQQPQSVLGMTVNCPYQPCFSQPPPPGTHPPCMQPTGMGGGGGGGAGFLPPSLSAPPLYTSAPSNFDYGGAPNEMYAACNECNNGGGGGGGGGGQPQLPFFAPRFEKSQMSTPCLECGALMIPTEPPQDVHVAGQQKFGGSDDPQQQQHQDPPGNYQEIGATMGGNTLTIRVHKDKNKVEQVDNCYCGEEETNQPPTNINPAAFNNYNQPPSYNPTNLNIPQPPYNQQQQQAFDFYPGPNKDTPFSLKMSGGDAPTCTVPGVGGAGPPVLITPPVARAPDGTQYTEISDPNREKFVLRIGKKSEGLQKRANLEVELQTPRGPEIKPRPGKETRDTQYDPADCKGEAANGGGGKKGKKGGKKGGGKKGGKKGKK